EGIAEAQIEMRRALGMRYLGQSWELVVDLPPAGGDMAVRQENAVTRADCIVEPFPDMHDRRFGHRSGGAVEIVSFRLAAIGRLTKPTLPRLQPAAAPGRDPVAGR